MSDDVEARIAKLEKEMKRQRGRDHAYEHILSVVARYLPIPQEDSLKRTIVSGLGKLKGREFMDAKRRTLSRVSRKISQARKSP